MENLTFNFTINQINLILKYLGSGAFVEVEPIINSIREQAASQLQRVSQSSDSGATPDEE
jgi:hypothetical protein